MVRSDKLHTYFAGLLDVVSVRLSAIVGSEFVFPGL